LMSIDFSAGRPAYGTFSSGREYATEENAAAAQSATTAFKTVLFYWTAICFGLDFVTSVFGM
jgi:hypothetical protein